MLPAAASDDGFCHGLAEIILGSCFHLLQNLGGNLGRSQLLATDLDPGITVVGPDNLVGHHLDIPLHHLLVKSTANQALYRKQRIFRIGNRLSFGGSPNQNLSVLRIGDNGRSGTRTFGVLDHLGLAVLHDSHT